MFILIVEGQLRWFTCRFLVREWGGATAGGGGGGWGGGGSPPPPPPPPVDETLVMTNSEIDCPLLVNLSTMVYTTTTTVVFMN